MYQKRRIWTQQPQYAAGIDWSIVTPSSAVIVPPRIADQVKGKVPTLNGSSGMSSGISPSGSAIVFAGGAGNTGGMQFSGVGGAEYTFIYHGSIEAPGSGYGRFYADEAVSGNNLAYYDSSSVTVENGPSFAYVSSPRPVTLVVVCTTETTTVWLNGVQKVTTAGRSVGAYQNVCFFNRSTDWGRQFKGACSLVAWIPKALQPAIAQQLSANPWQIFLGAPQPIFVTAEAVGDDYDLTATGITTSAATLSSPALAQNHAVTGSAIATAAAALGTPALAQNHVVTAAGIATASPTLSAPAITQNHSVTATAITASAAILGSPAIAQNHAITASAITTGAATLGSPAISGDAYNLTGAAITTTPTLSSPALSQNHALTGGAIAAGSPTFGTPTLAQQHALMATGITAGSPTLSRPILTDGSLPIYSRAPSGGGYNRSMADTSRAASIDTTRPTQQNTVRR